MVHTVDVFYRDGDTWGDASFVSHCLVEASSPREARLVAEQLAYTPHATKPDHIQIVGTVHVA